MHALASSAFGAALVIVFLAATLFFLALAGEGGFALLALAFDYGGALARFLLGDAASFRFTVARVGECALAGVLLVFRERAQQHAAGRSCDGCRCRRDRARRSLLDLRLRGARDRRLLDLGAGCASLDLDDDLLRAPMREALPDSALFDRTLQRQGLRGADRQGLIARGLGIAHSAFGPAGSVVCSSKGSECAGWSGSVAPTSSVL